jgi:Uma2 family endonuclease
MAQPVPHPAPRTIDEFLRFEEGSPVRHEYVGGEVYAMTGATARHNRIVGNIFGLLWTAARGGSCRVYTQAMKVRVADDVIYYPDVVVVCAPRSDDGMVVLDPCLIVEVASPGTARIDRREKLAAYRRVPSLRAYLIVDQRRRRVERHWRDADGDWQHEDLAGEGSVPAPFPETSLSLEEIYEGVEPGAVGEEEMATYEA